MPVSDKDYADLLKRLEALEKGGGGPAGLDPGKPHPQHPVEVKHRCGCVVQHPSGMVPGCELEKKAVASLRGRYCPDCATRKRQREVKAVAQAEADGVDVSDALTTRG
jgi:hypothetical protein